MPFFVVHHITHAQPRPTARLGRFVSEAVALLVLTPMIIAFGVAAGGIGNFRISESS